MSSGILDRAEVRDDVSFIEIGIALLRSWRVLVVLPLLFALPVGLLSLLQPRKWEASTTFMARAGERGGLGAAEGLARQFGIELSSGGTTESIQFYVDLLGSTRVLRGAVETEYRVTTDNGDTVGRDLIQVYDVDGSRGRPAWQVAVERLRRNLSTSVTRETGIAEISIVAEAPALAEAIAARLLDLMNEYNVEMRQQRATEEGRFVGARVAEAQAQLEAAEQGLENFLRSNRIFANSPELLFEHDRLQRQVLMRQEVFTSLLRAQEQIRVESARDLPVFTVIDPPQGTAAPKGRGTVVRAVIAGTVGLIVALFVAFVRETGRRGRRSGSSEYQEFRSLAGSVWAEIRRPARWVSGSAGATRDGDAGSSSRPVQSER